MGSTRFIPETSDEWLLAVIALGLALAIWYYVNIFLPASDINCRKPMFPDPVSDANYQKCLERRRKLQSLTPEDKGVKPYTARGGYSGTL